VCVLYSHHTANTHRVPFYRVVNQIDKFICHMPRSFGRDYQLNTKVFKLYKKTNTSMSPVVVSTAAAAAAAETTPLVLAQDSSPTNITRSDESLRRFATLSRVSSSTEQQQVNKLSSSSAVTGYGSELTTNTNNLKKINTEQQQQQQQPLLLTTSSDSLIEKATDSPRSHGSAEHRHETKVDWKSSVWLQCVCKHDQCMHKLTCAHLEARQFWFFTIPQALVTMLGGILAFLTTSDLFNDETNTIIATIVGSIAVGSVFIQTLEGSCKYGIRASMHGGTAIDLRDLRGDLKLLMVKLKAAGEKDIANRKNDNNKNNNNTNNSNSISNNSTSIKDTEVNEGGKTNTFESIEMRYRQSSQGCKSFVELSISEAFELLHTELMVTLNKNSMQHFEDIGVSDWYSNMYLGACDRLCAGITSYRCWPLFVPNSTRVVSNTMKLIQRDWKEGEDFWLKEI
jgi:hypothetical protein